MATKKSTSTSLLVQTEVPAILKTLKDKIAEMKEIETCAWKAGKNLSGFNNIQDEKLVENLNRAYTTIYGRAKIYDEAMEDLYGKGATVPVFKQDGYTLEEWKHDILLRKKIIEQKDNLDKLKEFESKMSKFLSEEDQKAMLLQEMESFLSGK